jgi:hypothetical protein
VDVAGGSLRSTFTHGGTGMESLISSLVKSTPSWERQLITASFDRGTLLEEVPSKIHLGFFFSRWDDHAGEAHDERKATLMLTESWLSLWNSLSYTYLLEGNVLETVHDILSMTGRGFSS